MSKHVVITGSSNRQSQGYVMGQWIAKILAFEQSLDLLAPLEPLERRIMNGVVAHCPTAAIEQMAAIAAQNGGSILGLEFNPDGAREVVAYSAAATPFIVALRAIAQHVEDDVLQREVQVADKVRAGLEVMKQSMRTDAGKTLRPQYTAIRAMMTRRVRRAPKKQTPPGNDTTANTGGTQSSTSGQDLKTKAAGSSTAGASGSSATGAAGSSQTNASGANSAASSAAGSNPGQHTQSQSAA